MPKKLLQIEREQEDLCRRVCRGSSAKKGAESVQDLGRGSMFFSENLESVLQVYPLKQNQIKGQVNCRETKKTKREGITQHCSPNWVDANSILHERHFEGKGLGRQTFLCSCLKKRSANIH